MGELQNGLCPLWQSGLQGARGVALAGSHYFVRARPGVKTVMQQRRVGQTHGLRQQ